MLKIKLKKNLLKAEREKTIYHLLEKSNHTNYYSENNTERSQRLGRNAYDILS